MQIYIITVGEYEDRVMIGVAESPQAADDLVARARLTGEFSHVERFGPEREDTYRVDGPYDLGQLYNGLGEKL